MKTPEEMRLEAAMKAAVHQHPFGAEAMLARAMVAAYTPFVAEAVADRMGDMVRATLGAVRPVQPDITGPLHDTDDHIDLQGHANGLLRIVRNIGIAAIFAALAWGFWTASNMTLDAVERQIEAGAVEW